MKKKGFTLIELLIVVAIIGILAAIILININQSRKNARVNGAKTSLRTILPAILACKDSNGAVTPRIEGDAICNPTSSFSSAFWPILPNGYAYGGGNYNSDTCNFKITTSDVPAGYLTCSCANQICE